MHYSCSIAIELVLMANVKKAIKISQKHLLGIQDLSISDVNFILSEAKQFINLNKSKNKNTNIYVGRETFDSRSIQFI